jgi:glycosyltransferase involved in cell wall biosynthesis
MRTAIVHDWIIDIGGAEKCLETIASLYPSSDFYTLVFKKESLKLLGIDEKRIKSSFIQKLPKAEIMYRDYLPLFPLAIEQFDLSDYELIISSSHAVAKGILTNVDQVHISYINNTMLYAWDCYHHYLKESGLNKGLKGWTAKLLLHYIRNWDALSAHRVDFYISNSNYVAKKIKKMYGKDSKVIYPPVDVDNFECDPPKDNFYLTVSRIVPFKRVDLIVNAFSRMSDRKLIVIGDGSDFKKIKVNAGTNIDFLGYQNSDVVKKYMQKAKAFVFASVEPFGIAPVEAQACGTPVIAYGKGGVLETVINGKTGTFFKDQTVEGLITAVNDFEEKQDIFDYYEIRKNAEHFSKERFRKEFKEFVDKKIEEY